MLRLVLPLIIAVAYLLPFGVPPFEIFSLSPSALDLSLTLGLVLWWLPLLLRRPIRIDTGPLGLPLLVFLALALLAFIVALDRTPDWRARMFLKLINSVLVYLTVLHAVRSLAALHRTVRVLLAAATGAAAIAIALYLLPEQSDYAFRDSLTAIGYPGGASIIRLIAETDVRRAVGTAVDPNVLGGMLALALPLATAQWMAARPIAPRWMLAAAQVLMAAAIILSYSRGAWIAALAGLGFLAWLRFPRVWMVLLLVPFFLVLPQGEVIIQRVAGAVQLMDPATQMRLGEYKDAVLLVARYPWLGVGFGDPPEPGLYVGVSSIYLLMAEQMGILGLAAFCFVMAALLAWALPRCRLPEAARVRPALAGGLAGVVSGLTAGLVDHYFFNLLIPHTVALFWLFVGLVVRAGVLEANEAYPRPHPTELGERGANVAPARH